MTRNAWIASATLFACGQSSPAPITAHVGAPSATATASTQCEASSTPYVARPVWSGARPDLPTPPALPDTPLRVGDSFTVYGAIHALHSRYGGDELRKSISIEGYIVDTNLARAPKCALHRTGVADPKGCVTEIPSFTIADTKGDTSDHKIRVMGWASNFANVFEAYRAYKPLSQAPAQPYKDELWARAAPFPLPAVGAKVRVTGRYAATFTTASTGVEADPEHGILTLEDCTTIERAPAGAVFPQLGP